jgi:hypothetical protein
LKRPLAPLEQLTRVMDPAEYCRAIETYLCRKNEGHLIRIVGPAFERVCGWAAQGVPLKIAFRGIDQFCERYYGKGPRRRPVRVEFCEADILDLFDGWRRAVGVGAAASEDAVADGPSRRKPALASHIERAIARLASARTSGIRGGAFAARIDAAVRELEHLANQARKARRDARTRIVERLEALDAELTNASAAEIDPAQAAGIRREVEMELAPFSDRMPPDALNRARAAAFSRLLREALRLPDVRYE